MLSEQYDVGTPEMRANYASLYAYGVAIPEALINAGYASRSLILGLKLLELEDVRAVIDQVRQHISSSMAAQKDDILSQLDRDRDFAYSIKNAAAAVSATMAKAKIMGLLDPDASTKVPRKILIEWGADDNLTPSSSQGATT